MPNQKRIFLPLNTNLVGSIKKHPYQLGMGKEQHALLDCLEHKYLVLGLTVREIAQFYGVPYTNKLQKLFCRVFSKTPRNEVPFFSNKKERALYKEFKTLYKGGYTPEEIARHYSIVPTESFVAMLHSFFQEKRGGARRKPKQKAA